MLVNVGWILQSRYDTNYLSKHTVKLIHVVQNNTFTLLSFVDNLTNRIFSKLLLHIMSEGHVSTHLLRQPNPLSMDGYYLFLWGAFKKKRAWSLGTETSTCMSEVLVLAVEALVALRHKVVNSCLVKFPGLCCEPVLHILLDVIIQDELFAPQSPFKGPKMASSQGEISGLYGGWPRTYHLNFCKSAVIVLAAWGLALSWSRMTPQVSLPGHFDLIAWWRVVKVCK